MSQPVPAKKEYLVLPVFIPAEQCAHLLDAVGRYRAENTVPLVHRRSGRRPLLYSVIDGEHIRSHFPDLLATAAEVNSLVNDFCGKTLSPLSDEKVAVNINITPSGGTYRWHYDRNAVTAILYLNSVRGGETECYPGHRMMLPEGGLSAFQEIADRLFATSVLRSIVGRRILVTPQAGTLFVMRGSTCLHSVRPVVGETDRVNVIFSYDLPGKDFAVADGLNRYLYESTTAPAGDPNYLRAAASRMPPRPQ